MRLIKTVILWVFLWPVLIPYHLFRWLSRSFRRTRNGGHIWIDVVGESQYYDNLRKICRNGNESADVEKRATLVLESQNPIDRSSPVRVEIDGYTVGYLPKESASLFKNVFTKRKTSKISDVSARVRGGWRNKSSNGNYGVKLRIDR